MDMTSATKHGPSLNHISLDREGNGAALQRITALLEMQCSGSYALVLPGVIFRHHMASGVPCTAVHLIDGITASALLADRGYDTQEIVDYALSRKMEVVIPPKRNRKEQREYDKYLYTLRHLVENAFLHLKRWRGIATRYAKNTSSFLATVQIRCIAAIWFVVLA